MVRLLEMKTFLCFHFSKLKLQEKWLGGLAPPFAPKKYKFWRNITIQQPEHCNISVLFFAFGRLCNLIAKHYGKSIVANLYFHISFYCFIIAVILYIYEVAVCTGTVCRVWFAVRTVGVFLTIVEEIFVSIDFYNLTLNKTVYVPRPTHSSIGFVIVQ